MLLASGFRVAWCWGGGHVKWCHEVAKPVRIGRFPFPFPPSFFYLLFFSIFCPFSLLLPLLLLLIIIILLILIILLLLHVFHYVLASGVALLGVVEGAT